MIVYLDASAIVKIITPERERALRRIRATATMLRRARRGLEQLNLIGVDHDIVHAAGEFHRPDLPTVDAVHLASALSLGADLEAVIAYDRRLAAAADAVGVTVLAPA